MADAIARGAVETAADLFYQAMLRIDTVETTAVVINSMIEVAGCEPPLISALEGKTKLIGLWRGSLHHEWTLVGS